MAEIGSILLAIDGHQLAILANTQDRKNVRRIWCHKLRSKAISDWKGEQWMFPRHKTEAMVREYDMTLPTAPSH